MIIRLRVKEVALVKGISQGKLSRWADLDKNTMRKIFQDPYSVITTDTLARIATALGVDPRSLIEGVPDDGEEPGQTQ